MGSTNTFLGRTQELEVLRSGLSDALGGAGRVLTVVGEPGVGKTRLLEEFAAESTGRAVVVWGRCWDGTEAPPFWPWTQVFRELVRAFGPLDEGPSAARAPHLAPLAPDPAHPADGSAPSPAADNARFRMFDAFAATLAELSTQRPILIALDDLHAADDSSLVLLRFVARHLKDSAVMIVGAYRDNEAKRDAEIAALLAGAGREGSQISLAGLPGTDVATMLAEATGRDRLDGLSDQVMKATQGNPLFVEEFIKVLDANLDLTRAGDSTGFLVPAGVADVVRRRLMPLSETTLQTLTVAAVLGREFDLEALGAAGGIGEESLRGSLAEALEVGVIVEVNTMGRYRFDHVLIREALYTEIHSSTRMKLHAAAASALEQLFSGDPDAHITELAHHHFKSAQAGERGKAIDFNIRAGVLAESKHAYEQAARHYARALRAAESERLDDDRRAELQKSLDRAQNQAGLDLSSESPKRGIEAEICREGDYWTLIHSEVTVRLKHTKGLAYLAQLLAEPRREFHALELAASADANRRSSAEPGLTIDAGVGDEVLDQEAKAAYRARLEALEAEALEAEDFNDLEKAERARAEIEAIAAQLAGALGLGTRGRKFAGTQERARVAVTKALRIAEKRIGKEDPALAAHLRMSIKTGTFCSYEPDPTSAVSWKVTR